MADEPGPSHIRLRRLGGGLVALVIGLGGVVLLLLFFQGRDRAPVHHDARATGGPGTPLAAPRRAALVAGGATRADGGREDAGELLAQLRAGDVVLLYGGGRPPAPLSALARAVAGPFSPALAASGQAVVLARRPGADGVVALAWRRVLRTDDPRDPALEAFTAFWLGRGAAG